MTYEPSSGRERLSLWFGLSYAPFAVLPRVLMQAMPDDWQERIAKLLEEADEAFPNTPLVDYYVTAKREDGKYTKLPNWLLNYRRANWDRINECRERDNGAAKNP